MNARLAIALWLLFTLLLVAWLFVTPSLAGPGKERHLPGATTGGHAQIERRCELCHTPFSGVKQEACTGCHGAALEQARDAHAAAKFADPRNADRLASVEATRCVTCHREHVPERTAAMGVTLPADFCRRCHETIGDERPTHRGMAFDSCAASGCHNFHDERALNEDTLRRHLDEPDVLPEPRVAVRTPGAPRPATPPGEDGDARIVAEWRASAHARGGVSCADCHTAGGGDKTVPCARCHEGEDRGFRAGKHGMALAAGLPPMTPGQARLPMRPGVAHRELGCASCHDAHTVDTRVAAVTACLGCHDDGHSRSYGGSAHHVLWLAELAGGAPAGSGVSCATCHLPRGESGLADHNQNGNLRPNEKMAVEVCGRCHGLAMTLDALADRQLVSRNFTGRPRVHVQSLDLVRKRRKEQDSR